MNLGLFFLRASIGSMMFFGHGLPKLLSIQEGWNTFPDPIGIGSGPSLLLAISAEAFCSAALVLGIKTRFVAVPLLVTMLVAVGIVHADDPWSKKEFALLYAVPFLTLIMIGGGDWTLENLWRRR